MSQIRKLWIQGPAGRLEAALRVAAEPRAVAAVAHPHPLHGGTMNNPVVFHSDRALHRAGLTTMRFNFRGTGTSEGKHDEGNGEVDDLAAAAAWVRGLAPPGALVLVGYSFGSVCAIRHASTNDRVAAVVGIGIPVRLYDFPEIERLRCPLWAVQGEYDEFGDPDEVVALLARAAIPGELKVVERAPHLFFDRAREVGGLVADSVRAALGD